MNHTPIFIALLCASGLHAAAQEKTDLTPPVTTPKFMIGLQAGAATLFNGNRYYYSPGSSMNLPGITSGVFARYYMGTHFALQTGLNASVYSTKNDDYYNEQGGYKILSIDSRMVNYSVPLQLQYHLLNKEARLRPYFGVGIVYNRTYHYRHAYTPTTDGGTSVISSNELGLQFTQGLTYQINKHWQINQSINLNTSSKNGTTASFMFGIGYSFGK